MNRLSAMATALALGQDPRSDWQPNFESLGMYCQRGAFNPNAPSVQHIGGCGCENTPVRIRGKMLMMETAAHGIGDVFPGYNATLLGDGAYFRIRDFSTGHVIANVSQSIGHSFCSAVADYAREKLWVFCAAHARYNKVHSGPCDTKPTRGCYVGAWHASFNDLTSWSEVSKALVLPDGQALFNQDVTLVSGSSPAAQGLVPGLPKHQAAMIIEGRSDSKSIPRPGPFAVNVGDDGDLTKNWIILDKANFTISGFPEGATGEGTGDAPTLRFDAEEGYYYSIGGGWITNGPARSPSLRSGSWEVSSLAPMAIPDARAAKAGLPAREQQAGFNTQLYSEIWTDGVTPVLEEWLANSTAWNWGVTDPDVCCDDGLAPSYIINTMSSQGKPSDFTGKWTTFSRIGRANMTLYQWFRSYFPTRLEVVA